MARRRRKRSSHRPRKQGRSFLYWFLALAALGGLAWLWWQAARPDSLISPPPSIHAKSPPAVPLSNPPPVAVTPVPIPVPPPPKSEPVPPASLPRPVRNVLEAQLVLTRLGISSGSLDGRLGAQTRAALQAFQRKEHLPVTGELDATTMEHLVLTTAANTSYTIAADDLSRLQPLSSTWLGKSQQSALDYETIVELLAEKGQAHPSLIRQLNPGIDWQSVTAGTTVQLPDVDRGDVRIKAAFVTIRLSEKTLEAFDFTTNLLAHFPCSIARHVEKRPVGELHVAVIALNPNYTFDPEIFPESAEARELDHKLILPPGPNNPVGLAWIGLDKPGYGIHGTPNPEQVGHTESHGCFRLANWNVQYLARLVWVGAPVYVEP